MRGASASLFFIMNDYTKNLCTTFRVKSKERLPYGTGDRGRFVPSEGGRRAIFVPSWGTMEKDEIDYVVAVAQEQEDERIKRPVLSKQKQELEFVANEMKKAPPGQRAKVAKQIIGGQE